MLFNSTEFLLAFLPLTFLIFHLLRRFSHALGLGSLAVMSLGFYGYGEPTFILLLATSILFNYGLGNYLYRNKQPWLLWAGIVFNLLLIAYFKYAYFIVDNLNTLTGGHITIGEIALPLAISFYTFQQIAFLADSYKSTTKTESFLEYLLFICFFPQLIAGPIVHHNQVVHQFANREPIPLKTINLGIVIYCIGLAKKVFIADFFAAWADFTFGNTDAISSAQAWLGTMAYTLQIYFDFSGYSDMAIGLGLMFGIRLPINFNSPYKSVNIIDFWRRWHITLSHWLRDYVYRPLGGKGSAEWQRSLNVLITMLIGGLWHGAGWTFVIWGGVHGLAIAVNHAWNKIRPASWTNSSTAWGISYRLSCWAATFLFAALAWVLFRADSLANAQAMYGLMLGQPLIITSLAALPDLQAYFSQDSLSFSTWLIASNPAHILHGLILLPPLLLAFLGKNSMELTENHVPGPIAGVLCGAVFLAVVIINTFLVQPNAFIYFRF